MDVSVIFQFLKNLATNNNREWFQEHKDEYLKAQKEFEELLTAIIARISLFDESIVGIQAKDCTYRIYRDTRFSVIRLLIKSLGRLYQRPWKEIRTLWILCSYRA